MKKILSFFLLFAAPILHAQVEISPAVERLPASGTLVMAQKLAILKSQGKPFLNAGIGQSPHPVPAAIQATFQSHVGENAYLNSKGLLQTREAISAYYQHNYGTPFSPENIIIFDGAKDAIFHLLATLEGDLILPTPSWVSYLPQGEVLLGKAIHLLPSNIESGYLFDLQQLEAVLSQIGDRQSILILNSPHNPTSIVYSEEYLKEIARVIEPYPTIVLFDGIYGYFKNFDETNYHTLAEYAPHQTILIGGLSKVFSACGYRVGFAAIPEALQSLTPALARLVSTTFTAVSTPTQYATATAYENAPEVAHAVERHIALNRLATLYLYERLQKMGLSVIKPNAGFYVMPDFEAFKQPLKKAGISTSHALSLYLLENANLGSISGDNFNLPAEQLSLRLSAVDYDGKAAMAAYERQETLDENFVRQYMPKLVWGMDSLSELLKSLED